MIDNRLFTEYPRIAAVADLYGFTHVEIRGMLNTIEKSQYREFILSPEINLKALMVRLDCNKDRFGDKITELFFKSLDEIKQIVGIQQVPLVYALYYKFS